MSAINLENIASLNKANVFIRNREELLLKIKQIVNDGRHRLQIISDFDLTLTRHFKDDGTSVPTTYDMFNKLPGISQACKDAMTRYAKIYKPREEDGTISIEQKKKYMEEWYEKVHEAMMGSTLAKTEVMEEANKVKLWFRYGVSDLVEWSFKNNVPFLVFSAGVGECARAVLEAGGLLRDNVKIIANFCKLDENEKIIGMQGNIIHTLNKNEAALETEYKEKVKSRWNVILLGDNLGDAGMGGGLPECHVLLKVGFLSREVPANREAYRRAFDIVLENEHSVQVVNDILNLMA